MALAHLRILIHEFLNNYPNIVQQEAHLTILDSKSAGFMGNNGKDTKNTIHIATRVIFVRDGKN